ncbi:MAG: response regulator transcription factor [Saprospiraceae bacterium]|nr:response regulator transcription factor [Saprospiraceae bacterium]
MGISIAAVRQYAHRIYKKLKVVNKTEAIIKYRYDLITRVISQQSNKSV